MSKLERNREESLRRFREEFRRIGTRIVSKKSVASVRQVTREFGKCGAHHFAPLDALTFVGKYWTTIRISILEIQVVREFVNYQIPSSPQFAAVGHHGVPRQQHSIIWREP